MITNIKDIPNNITGIYKITYDNNKVYIGQALNIKSRALEHNNKSKELCDIALKKHDAIILESFNRKSDFFSNDISASNSFKKIVQSNQYIRF